jgi:3-oxoacyl-[acyl-carrier protein] reductase
MTLKSEFEGKSVLITGGARNIGRELARMFAAAGAMVMVNSRSARKELQETADIATQAAGASGGKAIACVADITNPQDVSRLVKTTVDQFGRIDILINNAVQHAQHPFIRDYSLGSICR